MKVYRIGGAEIWLLIHIEVQDRADAQFQARMFQYYYRVYDRYGEVEIVSLAVVTNERPDADLGVYRREWEGYGLRFRFRVRGLRDWREEELVARAATNPFAVVALAQLAAHRGWSNPGRKARKREIIELLYRYRYEREDVLNLLRFIDWLIRLPRALELELRDELRALEEETSMAYVMSIERLAREEGWEEGREEGREEGEKRSEAKALLRLVQTKWGPAEPTVVARIEAAEAAQLEQWLERILTAKSPDELFG